MKRKFRYPAFLLFLFCSLPAVANTKLDSMLHLLSTLKEDSNKVKTLYRICWEYKTISPDTATMYCEEAVALATEMGFHKGLGLAYNHLGVINAIRGDYAESLEFFKKSAESREKINDVSGLASCRNNMGILYHNQGIYTKALAAYQEALQLYEKLGADHEIDRALNNLGVLYFNQGNYEKALEYYTRSLNLKEKLGLKTGVAYALVNIGIVHKNLKAYEKAFGQYDAALGIFEKENDQNGIAFTLTNRGVLYLALEKYGKAESDLEKAYKIYEEIGYPEKSANALVNLGKIKTEQQEYKKAREYLLQALRSAEETGNMELLKGAYESLSIVYEKSGDVHQSFRYFKKFTVLKDSIFSESKSKEIGKIEAKYEFQKEQEVREAEHRKEIEVSEEQREKQMVISYSVAGGLLLVVVFALILYKRLKLTRRQKQIIEHQKFQVDEKNKEILASIQYAKRIQTAILPPKKVVREYLEESFILYKPKDIVAGDFYWLEAPSNSPQGGEQTLSPLGRAGEGLFFAAADCTGHGVPGAMVSVMCSNALTKAVKELGIHEPAKILDKASQLLEERFERSEEEVKDGMDIALCSLTLPPPGGDGGGLQYAGANNPLYYIREGELHEVKGDKQPIGKHENRKPFTNHTIELQKGDTIYIFSDGFVDQFGGDKGKKFKSRAFKELLLSIQDKAMEEQKQIIEDTFEQWRGSLEQVDDVCIIGVKI